MSSDDEEWEDGDFDPGVDEGSDSDGDDIAEDGSLNFPFDDEEDEIAVEFTVDPAGEEGGTNLDSIAAQDRETAAEKRKRGYGISKVDRDLARVQHRVHLLSLLARARLVHNWSSDPLTQALLVSRLPPALESRFHRHEDDRGTPARGNVDPTTKAAFVDKVLLQDLADWFLREVVGDHALSPEQEIESRRAEAGARRQARNPAARNLRACAGCGVRRRRCSFLAELLPRRSTTDNSNRRKRSSASSSCIDVTEDGAFEANTEGLDSAAAAAATAATNPASHIRQNAPNGDEGSTVVVDVCDDSDSGSGGGGGGAAFTVKELSACSRCRRVFYCGEACRAEHWARTPGGHAAHCVRCQGNKKGGLALSSSSSTHGKSKQKKKKSTRSSSTGVEKGRRARAKINVADSSSSISPSSSLSSPSLRRQPTFSPPVPPRALWALFGHCPPRTASAGSPPPTLQVLAASASGRACTPCKQQHRPPPSRGGELQTSPISSATFRVTPHERAQLFAALCTGLRLRTRLVFVLAPQALKECADGEARKRARKQGRRRKRMKAQEGKQQEGGEEGPAAAAVAGSTRVASSFSNSSQRLSRRQQQEEVKPVRPIPPLAPPFKPPPFAFKTWVEVFVPNLGDDDDATATTTASAGKSSSASPSPCGAPTSAVAVSAAAVVASPVAHDAGSLGTTPQSATRPRKRKGPPLAKPELSSSLARIATIPIAITKKVVASSVSTSGASKKSPSNNSSSSSGGGGGGGGGGRWVCVEFLHNGDKKEEGGKGDGLNSPSVAVVDHPQDVSLVEASGVGASGGACSEGKVANLAKISNSSAAAAAAAAASESPSPPKKRSSSSSRNNEESSSGSSGNNRSSSGGDGEGRLQPQRKRQRPRHHRFGYVVAFESRPVAASPSSSPSKKNDVAVDVTRRYMACCWSKVLLDRDPWQGGKAARRIGRGGGGSVLPQSAAASPWNAWAANAKEEARQELSTPGLWWWPFALKQANVACACSSSPSSSSSSSSPSQARPFRPTSPSSKPFDATVRVRANGEEKLVIAVDDDDDDDDDDEKVHGDDDNVDSDQTSKQVDRSSSCSSGRSGSIDSNNNCVSSSSSGRGVGSNLVGAMREDGAGLERPPSKFSSSSPSSSSSSSSSSSASSPSSSSSSSSSMAILVKDDCDADAAMAAALAASFAMDDQDDQEEVETSTWESARYDDSKSGNRDDNEQKVDNDEPVDGDDGDDGDAEERELAACVERAEPMARLPTTVDAFKRHPRFLLLRHLGKFECLRGKNAMPATTEKTATNINDDDDNDDDDNDDDSTAAEKSRISSSSSSSSRRSSNNNSVGVVASAAAVVDPSGAVLGATVAGYFRGQPVYLRREVRQLRSATQWKRGGGDEDAGLRQVRAEERPRPAKTVPLVLNSLQTAARRSRTGGGGTGGGTSNTSNGDGAAARSTTSTAATSSMTATTASTPTTGAEEKQEGGQGEEQDEELVGAAAQRRQEAAALALKAEEDKAEAGETLKLYGRWQTEKWQPPGMETDPSTGLATVIPKNRYGNYELWDGDERLLPPGACWLRMPKVAIVAKALGLDFCPAVVGFSRGGGGGGGGGWSVPDVDGVVVSAAHRPVLTDAYAGWAEEQVARQKLKRERAVARKWEALVRNALTRHRLKESYGF